MSTVKEEFTRLIQGQPDDSSPEEIVRELSFRIMMERRLTDSGANRTISNEAQIRPPDPIGAVQVRAPASSPIRYPLQPSFAPDISYRLRCVEITQ